MRAKEVTIHIFMQGYVFDCNIQHPSLQKGVYSLQKSKQD